MNDYRDFGYYYDDIMQELDYMDWVDFTKSFCNTKYKILDLACGSLTFAILMKSEGYDISGLDLSESMLEVGREKAKMNHLLIPLYQMDMCKFHLDEKYDAITCYFDSFNHLANEHMVLDSLKCCAEHLVEGGLLLLDIFSHKAYLNSCKDETKSSLSCDYRWKIETKEPNILHHHLDIKSDDDDISEDYYEYYYPLELFTENPLFQVVNISGDFENFYDKDALRILLVLKKR